MAKLISVTAQGKQQLVEVDLASLGVANVVIDDVPCDSSVYVGAAVRVDAAGTAYNALADSLANSNIIGVCESKTSSTLCSVRVLGVSLAIFTGLDVTKEYYLSDVTAGLITTVIPTASGHVRVKIGQPFSATEMLVLKGERVIRS